jgi:hypothetical protein
MPLLAFLYPFAARALDHQEASVASDAPALALLTVSQRQEVLRRVLFTVLVEILGESAEADVRKLTFFAAETGGSPLSKLNSLSPAEAYVAGVTSAFLANRSAVEGSDAPLPPGVAGIVQSWKKIVATSFTDGEPAGQEGLQLSAMLLHLAHFASVVVLEPYVSKPTVPIFRQEAIRGVPGVHVDELPVIKLVLRAKMYGSGAQGGHYENIVVLDEAKVKAADLISPVARRLGNSLSRMRELLRKLEVATVPPAASSSGSPTGCASCSQAFDKVVPAQTRCVPCGMKKAANASPKDRACAVCEAVNMSSALLTNLACGKCSAALQLSAEQQAQSQKKAQAAEEKEAQKAAAALAAKVDAEYKAKQLALEQARQLARDKALHPNKPEIKCSTCDSRFVQKAEGHKLCFSCATKAGQTGGKSTSTVVKCTSCRASFEPRQETHAKCDSCWGSVPKPKAKATKAGSTGTGSSQASAAKSASQTPKPGAQSKDEGDDDTAGGFVKVDRRKNGKRIEFDNEATRYLLSRQKSMGKKAYKRLSDVMNSALASGSPVRTVLSGLKDRSFCLYAAGKCPSHKCERQHIASLDFKQDNAQQQPQQPQEPPPPPPRPQTPQQQQPPQPPHPPQPPQQPQQPQPPPQPQSQSQSHTQLQSPSIVDTQQLYQQLMRMQWQMQQMQQMQQMHQMQQPHRSWTGGQFGPMGGGYALGQ